MRLDHLSNDFRYVQVRELTDSCVSSEYVWKAISEWSSIFIDRELSIAAIVTHHHLPFPGVTVPHCPINSLHLVEPCGC